MVWGTTLVLGSLALLLIGCSSGDGSPLAMKLRDTSVEGGRPVFVTFELGEAQDASKLRIGPGLALRRDDRDVRVLLPRNSDAERYGTVNEPGTLLTPASLALDTEYRFDLPDVEPGFHQLCATYSIDAQPGKVCVEIGLG